MTSTALVVRKRVSRARMVTAVVNVAVVTYILIACQDTVVRPVVDLVAGILTGLPMAMLGVIVVPACVALFLLIVMSIPEKATRR